MYKGLAFFASLLGFISSFSHSLQAHECGDFLIRARALYVDPNDVSGFSSIGGGGASVLDNWTGEVDFTYADSTLKCDI